MIDKILKALMDGQRGEIEKYKKVAIGKVLQTAKTYRRYLAVWAVLIIIGVVAIIWAIWAIASWVAQGIGTNGGDVIWQVEQVGINGLIEGPLQFVRDIWYGKDGK